MSIKDISAAWKASLKTFAVDERIYLDSRKEIYPPYASDLTYTVNDPAANQPGSHNATAGHAHYMLEIPVHQ